MLKKKWYKFLIYISLWTTAVINVAVGIMLIYGTHYKELSLSKNIVYNYYLDLKQFDKFLGYMHILMSIYIIIVNYYLSALKVGAPTMLLAMHVVIIFFRILYIIVCPLNLHAFKMYNILSLIINFSMMIFNYHYFKKCKQVFIN